MAVFFWRYCFGGRQFSFFGGNDFGGRRCYQNMVINRHITGTALQGGNFTAGKIPTTTLNKNSSHTRFLSEMLGFGTYRIAELRPMFNVKDTSQEFTR